jgi:hypothetical protein
VGLCHAFSILIKTKTKTKNKQTKEKENKMKNLKIEIQNQNIEIPVEEMMEIDSTELAERTILDLFRQNKIVFTNQNDLEDAIDFLEEQIQNHLDEIVPEFDDEEVMEEVMEETQNNSKHFLIF